MVQKPLGKNFGAVYMDVPRSLTVSLKERMKEESRAHCGAFHDPRKFYLDVDISNIG
jgi:hypothetical protein